jgi:hypothetical protein
VFNIPSNKGNANQSYIRSLLIPIRIGINNTNNKMLVRIWGKRKLKHSQRETKLVQTLWNAV